MTVIAAIVAVVLLVGFPALRLLWLRERRIYRSRRRGGYITDRQER